MRFVVLFIAILLLFTHCEGKRKTKLRLKNKTRSKSDSKCKTDLIGWLQEKQLNMAASALQMTDMVDTFSNLPAGSTAFIPTDDAILSTLEENGLKQKDINKLTPVIKELLWYHVVPQKLDVKSLIKQGGGKFETMLSTKDSSCNANEIQIEISKNKIKKVMGNNGSAKIMESNLKYCDTTIHIIDSMLLDCKPKSLIKK